MPRIDVDPDSFLAASTTFGDSITTGLSRNYTLLIDGLRASTAMAGSDSTGQQWAHSYDEAARGAAAGTEDVINGCYKLAALLEANGFNHGYANAASTPGAVLPAPDTYGYEGSSISLPGPVSAHGGSGSGPLGWGLIASHLGGYLWPNGHQDKLHAAAAGWAQAARMVTEITYQVGPAVTLVASQVSPEIDDAVTVCTAMSHHLGDLSAAYNDLSTACTDYARHLDHAHKQIIDELISLLEWTAAIEAAGAVTGLFTFGAGEVAAQAAEGSRLAVTAARIVTFLEDLAAATKMITEFMNRIPTRILELTGALKPLLTARIIRIGTDLATLPEATPTIRIAEEIATNNLDNAAAAKAGSEIAGTPAGVPKDWQWRPANNGKGDVWQRPGAAGNADMVRIADSTPDYPNGYVRFYNDQGQPIDLHGKPTSQAATHIPRNVDGSYPLPKGWQQ
jgi:hypothetical protein